MNEDTPKKNSATSKVINSFSGDYERNKEKQRVPKGYHLSSNTFGLNELFLAFNAAPFSQNQIGAGEGVAVGLQDLLRLSHMKETPLMKEVLSRLRSKLLEKAKYSPFIPAVTDFITEFPPQKIPREIVSRCLGPKGEFRHLDFLRAIPDGLFLDMIINHAEKFAEKSENFLVHEKQLRRNFIKVLYRVCTDGVLTLDFPAMVNKINQARVHLQDALEMEIEKVPGSIRVVSGATDALRDLINISSGLGSKKEERATYTHEMLHSISGMESVLVEIKKEALIDSKSGLVTNEGGVLNQRTGFTVVSLAEDKKMFVWLNEATTEYLVSVFLDGHMSNSYVEEQKLLQCLLKSGTTSIPRKLLYEAYFSDSTSEHSEGVSPAMRKFYDAVDSAYGRKDFLTSLDTYVAKHGIEKAIQTLKTNPGQI